MSESPQTEAELAKLPEWFDEAKHEVTGGGIVRRSDHALLDDEGQPQSLALRGAEERAREAAKAAATEAKKQAKKEAADAGQ